jgi:hypothetical protein
MQARRLGEKLMPRLGAGMAEAARAGRSDSFAAAERGSEALQCNRASIGASAA